MEKLKVKSILLEVLNEKQLNEWGTLNTPDDIILPSTKYKINVFINDRPAMPPHFHFSDVKGVFHLEIQISNIEELKILNSKTKRKGIPNNKLKTWEGLSKEKKMLQTWLKRTSNFNKEKTNYQELISLWNNNNQNNKI